MSGFKLPRKLKKRIKKQLESSWTTVEPIKTRMTEKDGVINIDTLFAVKTPKVFAARIWQ